MRRMGAVNLIVLGVCLLIVGAGATAQTGSVPLTPAAQQTVAAFTAPPASEGYSDAICTSPQILTEEVLLGGCQTGTTNVPSIVWDGTAYGVVFSDLSGNIQFLRMAADGTRLTYAATLDSSSSTCYAPRIAWSGTEYGVTWYDARSGNNEIYFARVSASGAPVSGGELRVTEDSGSSLYPDVEWCGTEWGVAWHDSRTTTWDIYYARVSALGTKLGSEWQITSDAGFSYYPSLAWDGAYCGVAWHDSRSTATDIYFARVLPTGGKQGSDIQVTSDASSSTSPSLVWTGSAYGVAWQDTRTTSYDIYFQRLSAYGDLLGGNVQVTSDAGGSYEPSLAWTGSEFGVAFSDDRNGASDVYFARITAAGAKTGSDVRLTAVVPYVGRPRLAFGTLGYAITFKDTQRYRAQFLGFGCRSDSTPPACPSGLVETANSGAGIGLRWLPGVDTETEVAYHRVYRDSAFVATVTENAYIDSPRPVGTVAYTVTAVNANGRESLGCATLSVAPPEGGCGLPLSGEQVVSVGGTSVYVLAAAWTGTEYGVAWQDNRSGASQIYFARVAADGTRMGGDLLVSGSGIGVQYVGLAWSGSEFGIAWSDNRDGDYEIYFARVSAQGAKVGSEVRITTSTGVSFLAGRNPLTWSGAAYGLTWSDQRDGNYETYFARLSATGAKIGSDLRVTNDGATSLYASIAFSGAEYGLVWQDNRTGNYEVYFARVSASGAKVGGDMRLTTAGSSAEYPFLCWGPGQWGVTWHDSRDGAAEVYFTQVNGSGVEQGDDVRLTAAPSAASLPALAWSGSEYAVVWADYRAGNWDLFSLSVGSDGSGGAERLLTTAAASEQDPVLVVSGRGLGLFYARDATADEVLFQSLGCGAADTTAPSCPASPAVTSRTSTTVTLAWGPSVEPESDLGAYRIYRDGSLVGATTATTWTDAAFSPAMGYVYWITATNAAGLESGNCASVDTTDTTPPPCPSNVHETSRTSTTVTLGWDYAEDPESIVQEYWVFQDGLYRGTTASRSWTDALFDPAAGSSYSVLALNGAGMFSADCEAVSTADTTPPTCAENLLASGVTASEVTLTWLPAQDPLSGLKQYRLYRNNAEFAVVPAGTTTYTDDTLAALTTYNFAVKSEDWAGNLAPLCATSVAWISSAPITLFLTKNGDGLNADLDWNDVGINPYVVYRSTSPQSAGELKRVPISQTQDTVLQDGVKLWFYYIQQRE